MILIAKPLTDAAVLAALQTIQQKKGKNTDEEDKRVQSKTGSKNGTGQMV